MNTVVAVELENVTRHFEDTEVISETSEKIEEGAFVVIKGANGAGKTTLLRMIVSLLSTSKGEIKVFGNSTSKGLSPKQKEKIGWASAQEGGFFERLNGLENLKIFASLKGHGKTTLNQAIELLSESKTFQLSLHTQLSKQSSGMRQMLRLAKALLGQPDLLVLDEPYRFLDNENAKILSNVLSQYNSKRRTVILSTHEEIDNLSLDVNRVRILKLVNGKVRV